MSSVVARLLAMFAGGRWSGAARDPSNAQRPTRQPGHPEAPATASVGRATFVGASETLLLGSVELVGLAEIRNQLGPQWEKVAHRATPLARAEIERHLEAGDVCHQIDDSSFQIAFGHGDERRARLRATEICRAVRSRIYAEVGELEDRLTVQSFVANVPRAAVQGATDPISAAYETMLKVRNSVRERASTSSLGPGLLHAAALFQPIWPAQAFGRTINRCVIDSFTGAAVAKFFQNVADSDDLEGALATLDCVLFSKSVAALDQVAAKAKNAELLIPVHFMTLSSSMQFEFIRTSGLLPERYRRSVILNIIGAPVGAGLEDILEAIATAQIVVDRVVLQVSPSTSGRIAELSDRLWGISVDVTESDIDEQRMMRELLVMTQIARKHGLQRFCFGASNIRKATRAVEAGFNHVSGSGVHSTLWEPHPISRFTPVFGQRAASEHMTGRGVEFRAHPRFVPVNPNTVVTLPDGTQHSSRILNASISGAAVLSEAPVAPNSYLFLGTVQSQVVRLTPNGFAVRFVEAQQTSTVEAALEATLAGPGSLRSSVAQGRATASV